MPKSFILNSNKTKDRNMITLEYFETIPAGQVFDSGIMADSAEGLHMQGTGRLLRWLAKKGYGNDWAIYCFWEFASLEYIETHGQKVTTEVNIRRVLPCTDEVFKLYRK
jgi:hypothetical protein